MDSTTVLIIAVLCLVLALIFRGLHRRAVSNYRYTTGPFGAAKRTFWSGLYLISLILAIVSAAVYFGWI